MAKSITILEVMNVERVYVRKGKTTANGTEPDVPRATLVTNEFILDVAVKPGVEVPEGWSGTAQIENKGFVTKIITGISKKTGQPWKIEIPCPVPNEMFAFFKATQNQKTVMHGINFAFHNSAGGSQSGDSSKFK